MKSGKTSWLILCSQRYFSCSSHRMSSSLFFRCSAVCITFFLVRFGIWLIHFSLFMALWTIHFMVFQFLNFRRYNILSKRKNSLLIMSSSLLQIWFCQCHSPCFLTTLWAHTCIVFIENGTYFIDGYFLLLVPILFLHQRYPNFFLP